VLVFSIVSRKSFETIQQVNDALLNTLGDAPDVPRVLVGSMEDLSDQRQVSKVVGLKCSGTAAYIARLLVGCLSCLAQFYISLVLCVHRSKAAQTMADSLGVPYIECSAKTGENVAEVFHTLLKEIEKDDGLLAETGDGACLIL
jgi:Ras homolog enriched in brain